jgi:hypothetical protein
VSDYEYLYRLTTPRSYAVGSLIVNLAYTDGERNSDCYIAMLSHHPEHPVTAMEKPEAE